LAFSVFGTAGESAEIPGGGKRPSIFKRKAKIKQGNLIIFLQKIYISIFGVPEIGFQLRSLYFLKIVEGKLIKKNIKCS